MSVLIDTHVLLWAATDDRRLSAIARRALADPLTVRVLSVASIWEMAVKNRIGRLRFGSLTLTQFVESQIVALRLEMLDVTRQHAFRVAELEGRHSDPFDLLLIAQTQVEGHQLLTSDRALRNYDVSVVW